MKLFIFTHSQNCELKYPVHLPGGKCGLCGRFFPSAPCDYASANAASIARTLTRYKGMVLPMSDFIKMRQEIVPYFPHYALIGGGTDCGLPSGRIFFKHKDLLFSGNGMLFTENGYAELQRENIGGSNAIPVTVNFGKKTGILLYIVEFPGIFEEPPSAFSERCKECGLRKRRDYKERASVYRKSIQADVDIGGFRSEGVRYTIVTEKMRDLLLRLHGGNGLWFSSISISD